MSFRAVIFQFYNADDGGIRGFHILGRSLAIAEAVVGQLFPALVSMAMQTRAKTE